MAVVVGALLLAGCATEPPLHTVCDGPEGARLRAAVNEEFAGMVEQIERVRHRLGIHDDAVVVVPVDRLENDTGDYYPEARLRMLADLLIDRLSEPQRGDSRSQLVVAPYEARRFQELIKTEGLQRIEDCVLPRNLEKIRAAMQRTNQVAHGYARLKLRMGQGEGEFFVLAEFVPLNGEAPIRTTGSLLPPA